MSLFFKRINIFLLSLFIAFSPVASYAIDPIVPPFTSAPAAADVAAALGAGETGGFAAGLAGVGVAAAAIGVGVGAFCIASAVQGANSCGVNSAICNALTGAMISCTPNPDGSFSRVKTTDPTTPSDSGIYLYALSDHVWKTIGGIYSDIMSQMTNSSWHVESLTFSPTKEPYTLSNRKDVRNSDGYVSMQQGGLLYKLRDVPVPPDTPTPEKVPPDEVGRAVAGNPAAAAAVGAAAAAAAAVGSGADPSLGAGGCSGSVGTFNGVSKCIAPLAPSSNPSCTGYYGVTQAGAVCVNPLGADATAGCSGFSGTVNGVTRCIPSIGSNSGCVGYLGEYLDNPVCIGDNAGSLDPAKATSAANAAAANAATHPPSSRSCPTNFRLDVTGICINTTIPERGSGDCKIGYIFSNGSCVPSDPMNPYKPASTTPQTSAQTAAAAAVAGAKSDLATAKANAAATAADAAANPTDQTKAAAAAAAAAALQKAQLNAIAANTAATANAASEPKSMELPAFCGWAAIVCDVISWVKTEAKAPTDTAVTVKSDTPADLQNFDINKKYFNFGQQCPADVPISFTVLGHSTTLNFQYSVICDFLTRIRPFVIATAWIAGAYIVSGSSRGGGDS